MSMPAILCEVHEGGFFGSIHRGNNGVFARAMPKTSLLRLGADALPKIEAEFPTHRNLLESFCLMVRV